MTAMSKGIVLNLFDDGPMPKGVELAQYQPASTESVAVVLAADPSDPDGRSEWLWVRLPNGDLILGVFPQGDTYFLTERDHS